MKRAASEAGLVLTAMDINNTIIETPQGFTVMVAEEDQAMAHWQLTAYWTENRQPAEKPVDAETVDSGWLGVMGYLLVIWSIPALQSFSGADLGKPGRLDSALVQAGELWRPITALTLHADIAHILSNSFFGALFGLFVGRYLGSGYGWLLVLGSAAVANLTNALLQPEGFRAIGASTATFAALGLVPAFGWRRGYFRGRGARRGFAPIFGAIALFSFTGFGTDNTDVLGHLFGFVYGLVTGLLVARVDLRAKSLADQQRAGAVAVGVVALAWLSAL